MSTEAEREWAAAKWERYQLDAEARHSRFFDDVPITEEERIQVVVTEPARWEIKAFAEIDDYYQKGGHK